MKPNLLIALAISILGAASQSRAQTVCQGVKESDQNPSIQISIMWGEISKTDWWRGWSQNAQVQIVGPDFSESETLTFTYHEFSTRLGSKFVFDTQTKKGTILSFIKLENGFSGADYSWVSKAVALLHPSEGMLIRFNLKCNQFPI